MGWVGGFVNIVKTEQCGGWRWLSSTIILSAARQKVGLAPTDVVGTMAPPAVTSQVSTTAQWTRPKWP